MIEIPRAHDFATLVNKSFLVAGHTQVLTLVSLETREPAGWEASARKPLSLILRGAPGEILPEGLHHFTVDGHWQIDLYLVPIQTASDTYQNYQIILN